MAEYTDKFTLAAFNALSEDKPGTCKLIWGSYTGTGTYGSNQQHSTLTIPTEGTPLIVVIRPFGSAATNGRLELYHHNYSAHITSSTAYRMVSSWDGNTVSWYCAENFADGGYTTSIQMNSSGVTYYYYALIGL